MKNVLLILIIALMLSISIGCGNRSIYQSMDGDIVFQDFRSSQSKAIKLATNSEFSHTGMVVVIDDNPFVLEAVQPVRLTKLSEWITQGVDEICVIKRLKNRDSIIDDSMLDSLKAAGANLLGKNYDNYFNWSDETLYCSELVWKLYHRSLGIELCPVKKLKEFDLSSEIVKKKLREKYGENIPYDEPVVAPSDIFNSKLLITVYSSTQ